MRKQRILVWLSWWVDSAVSAYLLKQQGYDVTAWFMINYLAPEWESCPTKEDIKVAREVAKYLSIPFFTFDYRKEYEKEVLDYIYEWYKSWITPNPDIICNSKIKFKLFLYESLILGFDMVATWHYAQILKGENNIYHLKKWIDKSKDQSYFLAWLNQDQLSKTIFPIGHLEKIEVRKLAKKINLPNATRKDSQWICFVWKVDLIKFLEKKIKPVTWLVKNTFWDILGEHKWAFYYTIWQRKGLNIWGQAEPIFVVKKNIEKNEIIVWNKDDLQLYNDKLFMRNIHFINISLKNKLFESKIVFNLKAKIRYRQEDQECKIIKNEDKYEVRFINKQRAISSGQICAIYNDDELIMSGVIE